MKKPNASRRKVTEGKVATEAKRQVTFSKRRQGLEKKASELVTLTGSDVLTVVFSPGNKVFTFGHPSVDSVIQRFLGEGPAREPGTQNTEDIVQAHRSLMQNQINFHLNQLNELVDAEQKRGEEISRIRRETEGKVWWERPIEEMNVQQLEELMVMMRDFKRGVLEEARLLQQEEEVSEDVPVSVPTPVSIPVPVPVHVHVPSNVVGGGVDGGPVHDPKGKGIPNELSNSWASFDPMVGGSSNPAPLPGLDGGAPLDPRTFGAGMPFNWMSLGSSSQSAPLDPIIPGFDFGEPFNGMSVNGSNSSQSAPLYPIIPGFDFGEPFNGMSVNGSNSSQSAPLDPIIPGFDFGEPFNGMSVNGSNSNQSAPLDPIIPGFDFGEPFNGMSVVGSSSQVPLDPSTFGFYGGAPYDPMAGGSSGAVSFNQMGIGFDDDYSGLAFNPATTGFQDGGLVDPNAPGPSNGGGNWRPI